MPSNKVTVGNVEIISLTDGLLEFDLASFYPSVPVENWRPFEDGENITSGGKIRLNLASFLVRSDGRNILVDTGMGPAPSDTPETGWGKLLGDLEANSISPDEIDMVVMTHLHGDHVGWNLLRQGPGFKPTFPNARYWVSAKDLEVSRQGDWFQSSAPNSVWPLEELGLLEVMEGEHSITSELTTLPTPGHTPGHMCIMITSNGNRALILGDAAHSPVQVHETEWNASPDGRYPDQARLSRRTVMEMLEREDILLAAGHFPAPGFGRVVRLEGRRYWQPLAAM